MVLVYRHEKNAPLSHQELDGNFKDLDQRIQYLEEKIEKANILHHIKIEKERIFFLGTQGHVLADIPVPTIKFTPRGSWAPQTYYQKFDVVAVPGQTFLCTENHCSGTTLQNDITEKKWQLFIDVLTLLKGK